MKGKFEAFYDNYTKQWSVRKKRTEICVIYPCISEDMANEFAKLLNELNDENKELKKQNENLLAKLKYTCDQINYSDKLREMMK